MAESKILYKKLVKLAKSLPSVQQQETLENIRAEFRKHYHVTDPAEVSELLRRAQSKIGYLKIVTPRTRSNAGISTYVYKDGERIEGKVEGIGPATYKLQDMEEGLKRHHKLLRRQYFMDR